MPPLSRVSRIRPQRFPTSPPCALGSQGAHGPPLRGGSSCMAATHSLPLWGSGLKQYHSQRSYAAGPASPHWRVQPPTPPRGGAAPPGPGKDLKIWEFPEPGDFELSASTMDKRGSLVSGSHRSLSTSSPVSSCTPGTADPNLRAQPHGPHRDRRHPLRPSAPPGRAAAPAPGRRLPARSRSARGQ